MFWTSSIVTERLAAHLFNCSVAEVFSAPMQNPMSLAFDIFLSDDTIVSVLRVKLPSPWRVGMLSRWLVSLEGCLSAANPKGLGAARLRTEATTLLSEPDSQSASDSWASSCTAVIQLAALRSHDQAFTERFLAPRTLPRKIAPMMISFTGAWSGKNLHQMSALGYERLSAQLVSSSSCCSLVAATIPITAYFLGPRCNVVLLLQLS